MNSEPHCLTVEWPAPAQIRAAFTTRKGGRSRGPWASLNVADQVGDEPLVVAANRAALSAHLGMPTEPCWLTQSHSDILLDLDQPTSGRSGDAAITSRQVATVMVADCLPVLLCDEQGRQVAAVHAGWRGLATGLIIKTVAAFSSPPATLLAWLGPAIGPAAYRVGDDLYQRFVAADPHYASAFHTRGQHWHMDLARLAILQLNRAGVVRVSHSDRCVYDDPQNFFSYRRDGATGRMAALIWIDHNA